MLRARRENVRDKHEKIVVSRASDQTTMESVVSAQHGFITMQYMVKTMNIAILKIQSILVSRTNKVPMIPTPIHLLTSYHYLQYEDFINYTTRIYSTVARFSS